MNTLILVLRIVHISAGIVWGGGSIVMYFFFGPAVKATNQIGQQFAGYLMLKSKFVMVMTTMATLTVLAGAILYWLESDGFTSGWMKSSAGIGFAVGGLFGLVAFISGVVFGQMNKKLAFIGSQVQGKPTPEQLTEIQSLQKKIAIATRFHVPSIIITILLMSASRYLLF
ncbi:MAG: DUF2269 family protein [Chloroflexota bacterium]|nr:hypothetical protein [Chloroflexota bacterium]MBI5703635.1 hypothetical protein [Chloroflexota bacterium]